MTEHPSFEPIRSTWLTGLAVASGVFLLAEFLYEKHPHVRYESWFGFYGIGAMIVTVLIVVVSVLLRGVLRREGDYYDG